MPSCILFHGPGAREAALRKVEAVGHLMAPPYGDGGLKVDDAREMVLQLLNVPLRQGLGVVIAGPMDEANPKASDVLLKSIEEFDGEVVLPLLWANDLGGVSLTIRSRCLDVWCPGIPVPDEDDEEITGMAWELVTKFQEGDITGMPGVFSKKFKEKNGPKLVGALSEIVATRLDDLMMRDLWERLRKVARWTNPKPVEILSALMGGS